MANEVSVGARIRERLIALDYVKPNGDLNVQEFCWEHKFGTTHLYAWLSDKMRPFKELVRLCDALECSERWLLTGVERDPKVRPARGRQNRGKLKGLVLALVGAGGLVLWPSGSAQGQTLGIDRGLTSSVLSEVRRRLRRSSAYLQFGPACA